MTSVSPVHSTRMSRRNCYSRRPRRQFDDRRRRSSSRTYERSGDRHQEYDDVPRTSPSTPSITDLLTSLSSYVLEPAPACRGCNIPVEWNASTDPVGYYDEKCTCTYCPSCHTRSMAEEYDPEYPFYESSSSCTCTTDRVV